MLVLIPFTGRVMVVRDAQAVRSKIQDRMKVGLCGVQKNIPLVLMLVVMTRATAAVLTFVQIKANAAMLALGLKSGQRYPPQPLAHLYLPPPPPRPPPRPPLCHSFSSSSILFQSRKE